MSTTPPKPTNVRIHDIEGTAFACDVRWDGYDVDGDPLMARWTAYPRDGIYSGLPVEKMTMDELPEKTSIRIEIKSR